MKKIKIKKVKKEVSKPVKIRIVEPRLPVYKPEKTEDFKVEDTEYWQNRLVNDKRLDWPVSIDFNGTWIDGYVNSKNHPHRQLIMTELEKLYPFSSLIEIGANCGPNLKLIKDKWPSMYTVGVDINKDAIKVGEINVPAASWQLADIKDLNWNDKTFDIALSDAVLIYINPQEIKAVLENLIRITKKAIILVEWFDKSLLGEIKYFHWARDYKNLFKLLGQNKTDVIKIPAKIWPTENWSKLGYIFVCHLQ